MKDPHHSNMYHGTYTCIAGHPTAYTESSSNVGFLGNPNQLWEGQPWPILLCVNSFNHFIQTPRDYYDHEDHDHEDHDQENLF